MLTSSPHEAVLKSNNNKVSKVFLLRIQRFFKALTHSNYVSSCFRKSINKVPTSRLIKVSFIKEFRSFALQFQQARFPQTQSFGSEVHSFEIGTFQRDIYEIFSALLSCNANLNHFCLEKPNYTILSHDSTSKIQPFRITFFILYSLSFGLPLRFFFSIFGFSLLPRLIALFSNNILRLNTY